MPYLTLHSLAASSIAFSSNEDFLLPVVHHCRMCHHPKAASEHRDCRLMCQALSEMCLLSLAGVTAAPTVAGAAARAVTAFAVSPMELIRVRVQGSAAPAGISYTQQLMSTVRSIHAQGEVSNLPLMPKKPLDVAMDL